VKLNFFPRQTKFFKFLLKEAQMLKDGSAQLLELVRRYPDVEETCAAINKIERESNVLYREISRELSVSFIAELDREDIHAINRISEELLNYVKAAASKMALFNFPRLRKPAGEIAEILDRMAGELGGMVEKLEKLRDMSDHSKSMQEYKEQAERLLWVASNELYEIEGPTGADVLEIFKWSVVYEALERAVTCAEQAGTIIEGIFLKNS